MWRVYVEEYMWCVLYRCGCERVSMSEGNKYVVERCIPCVVMNWVTSSKATVSNYCTPPQVRKHSLAQVNSTGGSIAEYDFKDIEFMARVLSIVWGPDHNHVVSETGG